MKSILLTFVAALVFGAAVHGQQDDAKYKRITALTDSAPKAYIAGDAATAVTEANELLELAKNYKLDWNYGNAVHTAHIVLGRVAADEGKVAEAKRRLNLAAAPETLPYGFAPESVEWKASPQLDSFGPDMSLARELLERGERDAVLEYLDACARFWRLERGRLAEWRAEIKSEKIPDFGANMRYVFSQ